MTATVIDLQEQREARQPHVGGPAKCLACGHNWLSVSPLPITYGLECPECGTHRGVYDYPLDEPRGTIVLTCIYCGDTAWIITPDHARCIKCGGTTTDY